MDYSSIYFGKPLGQLTYDDIELFFSTAREETDQIEFKSFNPNGKLEEKLPGLTQGITAFLNSSGGVLVWGAPEGKMITGKRERVYTGNLTKLPLSIEKDWLISKVSDKIIPLPSRIRVQLITKGDSQVCVFEIDESLYSPHQTEGTYYMRIDGQKKPAPHHYVEALFKKITFPQIEAYITPTGLDIDAHEYRLKLDFTFINYSPFENEENFNYKVNIVGGRFTFYTPHVVQLQYDNKGTQYKPKEPISIFHYGENRMDEESITLPTKQLSELDNEAMLYLFFGGKKSPMKFNLYKIDFKKLKRDDLDLKSMFEIVYENKLMSDLHSESGHTKESRLQAMGVLRRLG